uniref:Uncharacterized protein n=1 Tax=Rhizophora mucronata TaxID=61149 RepID=A0A2P2P9B2_RHIMU
MNFVIQMQPIGTRRRLWHQCLTQKNMH